MQIEDAQSDAMSKGNICRIVDGNVGFLSDQGWHPFWEGAALFAVSLLLPSFTTIIVVILLIVVSIVLIIDVMLTFVWIRIIRIAMFFLSDWYWHSPCVARPHCGLDDSKNIARLVAELLREGLVASAQWEVQDPTDGGNVKVPYVWP